jgi:hypothetical protein
VNLNIPAPKIEDLQKSPKTLNYNFIENGSNVFDYISLIYGERMPKYNRIGAIFRKTTVSALGAQTRNVDFVETGFIGETDFIATRRSATNKVNRVWQIICNVSAPHIQFYVPYIK